MHGWEALWVISVIKTFMFAMLSDFLFIDTHSKFCLSDRTLQNAKVGESFQVEGNWVCKTDTDWFSKCQAVILSNKSHNHNRRGSLSSSCWKRRYLKKREKKMFHLLACSARVHNSEDFCTSVFIMIDITLIFQIPWITWLGKYLHKLWMPPRKKCTTAFSVYLSCHWVVRVQWCWQLIHVQMSPLPGWQSEYIKLTFPSVRVTGCSESRQQSCHKQLSALTIIRFIYWQWSGRTISWKAPSEDRDILSS